MLLALIVSFLFFIYSIVMVLMMGMLTQKKSTHLNNELDFSINKLSLKVRKRKVDKFLFFFVYTTQSILSWKNYTAGKKRIKVVKQHKAIWHKSKFKRALRVEIKLDFEFSLGKLYEKKIFSSSYFKKIFKVENFLCSTRREDKVLCCKTTSPQNMFENKKLFSSKKQNQDF